MRTVGIYYAYWTNDWDADFLPFVSKVKNLGYDQLEVHAAKLLERGSQYQERLKAEALDKGIILSYGIGMPHDRDLSSPDENIRLKGVAYMTDILKCIGRMGGGMIGGSTYCAWPKQLPKGEDKRTYVDQSRRSLEELVKVAEDNDVILNIEVLNRFEQFIFNTCAEALPVVKEIDSPNLGLLLDTFHMNIEEDSLPGAIRLAGPYMKALHAGETNRKPVGMGRQPWKEIRKALDDIHFDGPIVQEPFVMPGGEVGQDISVWRDIVETPDLDAMAKASAEYMRRVLV